MKHGTSSADVKHSGNLLHAILKLCQVSSVFSYLGLLSYNVNFDLNDKSDVAKFQV